jgi:hypothetical protein
MSRLHDLVADTVSNRLFRTMRVTQVSDLGPFREISLTSVASWTPGDKIQLRVAFRRSSSTSPPPLPSTTSRRSSSRAALRPSPRSAVG